MIPSENFLVGKGWDARHPGNKEHFKAVAALLDEYRLLILKDVKFGFDICSDTSTTCLGYRNLVDRIRREEEGKNPEQFPWLGSPYNPMM